MLSVLEELARTFPDTTWVQKLDIKLNGKAREVTVLGEAQSASKVIENLEQSPLSLFQNSKQLTQTFRVTPNTERFHVSAEIKPRPVPAAESIDHVATPATMDPIPLVSSDTSAASPTPPVGGVTPAPEATVTSTQPISAAAPPAAAPVKAPVAPAAKRSGS